jgi:hypothetical protein
METHGTGHGRNVVENFLHDTHFGHPSFIRPYTPIGGSPPVGGGGTPHMRLGVGKPPHGVWWGVGPSSSVVFLCNPVSAILPISLEISCRTPILAAHPQGHIRPSASPHPSA